jgi:hypothetical protein
MGASQSIKALDSSAFHRAALQKVLRYLAVAAVALFVAGSANLRAQRDVRIPGHALPPDFPASVSDVIPTPQYLPAGYELWKINRHPADGFGTGKTEIEVQYKDPRCWARKIRCSLQVFVSPMTDRPFSGTALGTAESVSLPIGKRTVQARYFKSMEADFQPGNNMLPNLQRPHLTAANFNALVFPFDRFMIGILGSKQGGVDRSELIKVAKSLAYAAR